MFSIEPFIGPLPLRFGMTPEEVTGILGPPDIVNRDPFGNRTESRLLLSLGYSADNGQLQEAVFSPGSELLLNGVNPFQVPDPINFLRTYDSHPQYAVGIVFFLAIGVCLTGFLDRDESQKSISVTQRGHWDDFTDEFVPFGVSKS